MSTKVIGVILLLFIGGTVGYGQVSTDPQFYYSNFEYKTAADLWERQMQTKTLTREERVQLVQCYLNSEQPEKGIPLVNSLINEKEELPLLKAKALFLYQAKQFSDARDLAITYRNKGGTELSPIFEENCNYSITHTEEMEGTITLNELNTQRAESLIYMNNDAVILKEIGLDSLLENARKTNKFEEVFFLRPFLKDGNTWKEWKIFDEKHQYWSLTSIQWDNLREIIYFSASQPLSGGRSKMYWASFEGFSSPITNIQELDFAGALKGASSGQIALSADGNWMVFSAISESTNNADLMQAHFQDNKWQAPVALAQINTSGDDLFPSFDRSELRFSTDGKAGFGGLDIWSIAWENGTLSGTPNSFSKPINSSNDDFWAYGKVEDIMEFSSNRFSGMGDDDVMIFTLKPDSVACAVVIDQPVDKEPAPITFIPNQRVYFGFDFAVTNDLIKYVDQMIAGLKVSAGAKIVVTGHTDAQGPDIYNVDLAMRRAVFIKNKLISMGIPENQIVVYSKGEELSAASKHALREEFTKDRFVEISFLNP